MDSFRGELIRVLALVYFVRALLDFYGDLEGRLELRLHCDKKAANNGAETLIMGRGLKAYLEAEYNALA